MSRKTVSNAERQVHVHSRSASSRDHSFTQLGDARNHRRVPIDVGDRSPDVLRFGSGPKRRSHEWFSWLFLAAAGAHIAANSRPFVKHLKSRWGKASVAAFVVILVASFSAGIGAGGHLRKTVEQALVDAPLSTLASLTPPRPGEPRGQVERAWDCREQPAIHWRTRCRKPPQGDASARGRVHERVNSSASGHARVYTGR